MRKIIATLNRIAGELKQTRKDLELRGDGTLEDLMKLSEARDRCMLVAEGLEERIVKGRKP